MSRRESYVRVTRWDLGILVNCAVICLGLIALAVTR